MKHLSGRNRETRFSKTKSLIVRESTHTADVTPKGVPRLIENAERGRLRVRGLLLSDESWMGGWVRGDGRFIVNLFIRFETIERGFLLSRGIFIFPCLFEEVSFRIIESLPFYKDYPIMRHPLFISVSK